MYSLDFASVRTWNNQLGSHGTYWYPGTISINCPNCSERGNFSLGSEVFDHLRNTATVYGSCPVCKFLVNVWAVNKKPPRNEQENTCEILLIYPAPAESRLPIDGIEAMPPRIRRAYRDVLVAFNAGIWAVSMSASRRVLEGLVKEVHPMDTGSLYKRIEQMIQHADLKQPLLQLAHAVREGGNLGAHFDDEKDPDKEIAQATLDLIEYFLEFVYALPEQARRLNERIEELEGE